MKPVLKMIAGLVLIAGINGCVTLDDSSEVASQREDINIIRENLHRVQGQMETVELENRRMTGEFDKLRSDCSNSRETDAIRQKLDNLERQILAVNTAREQDKQAIVDQLSAKIAEIMSKTSRPSYSTGSGNEHIVQSGETLSAIAAAYKIKSSAIVQANDLADPNNLRVGQKLVIPR